MQQKFISVALVQVAAAPAALEEGPVESKQETALDVREISFQENPSSA